MLPMGYDSLPISLLIAPSMPCCQELLVWQCHDPVVLAQQDGWATAILRACNEGFGCEQDSAYLHSSAPRSGHCKF